MLSPFRAFGPARRGFTLIELLVVLAIVAVLAGLSIYAYRPMSDRNAVNSGASLLQSWLMTARQRAIRDQAPRGLRLFAGDELPQTAPGNNPFYVTKAVYIEGADDLTGQPIFHHDYSGATLPPAQKSWAKKWFDLSTSLPAEVSLTLNDDAFLEIDGGPVYKIEQATGTKILLYTNTPQLEAVDPDITELKPSNNAKFRIYRRPTAIQTGGTDTTTTGGQDILRLPSGSIVNLETNNSTFATLNRQLVLNPGTGDLDILFAADGSVLTPPNEDRIALWVCGTILDNNGAINAMAGQPALVVVYPTTGAVSGYDVDLGNAANPYTKVK